MLGELCRQLGIMKTCTTTLHPQSDGLVEWFHCWPVPVWLGCPHSPGPVGLSSTPAALMFGHKLRTWWSWCLAWPLELPAAMKLDYLCQLWDHVRTMHKLARQHQDICLFLPGHGYDVRCWRQAVQPGEFIWVYCSIRKECQSHKLGSHWRSPRDVLQWFSDVLYKMRARVPKDCCTESWLPGPIPTPGLHGEPFSKTIVITPIV